MEMKRLLFFVILSLGCFNTVLAQDELDDFDFFEQSDEEEDEFFKKKDEKDKGPKKKKKSLLGGYAYYHIPGNVTTNFGLYFLNTPRSTAIPTSLDIEVTTIPNWSIGFRYVYYQYKTFESLDSSRMTSTTWLSRDERVNDKTFAGLLTVHISEYIGIDPSKFDIYTKVFVGTNSVTGDWDVIGLNPEDISGTVFGASAGIKFLYSDLVSMYADIGYSRFGLVNFGLTYRIFNLQL